MSITLPKLPEPELFYWKPSFVKGESVHIFGYTADQMHAYTAAVSAAKDKEIERLRADVAGLREDAERYRWLRDKLDVSDQATWNIFMSEGVEQWDAAIDAARKGGMSDRRCKQPDHCLNPAWCKTSSRCMRDSEPEIIRPTITRPEPDCRTCTRSNIRYGITSCRATVLCTNGDQYRPLQPIHLWKTT